MKVFSVLMLSFAISVSHLCPNDLSTYRVLLYDTPIE